MMRTSLVVGTLLVVLGMSSDPARAEPVDHSAFDALVKKYVNEEGSVDYDGWKKADVPALDAYLTALGKVDPSTLDRTETFAFWINAYNAQTVRFILSVWPTESIRDHTARFFGFNAWKDYPLKVRGKDYSLHVIEHEILRPMGEPLVHMGLNCASKGCPRLRREAYTGARVIHQLKDDARAFLSDREKLRIDRDSATVYVSKIFDWFDDDFGGSDRAVLAWIRQFVEDEDSKRFLGRTDLSVDHLEYDWAINVQRR